MKIWIVQIKVECLEIWISVRSKNIRCSVFVGRTDKVEAMAIRHKI